MYLVVLGIYIFIVGLLLGSFLNVLIIRTHTDEPWWQGRSKCPECHKELSWKELIPVFSYIYLKGRCKNCRNKISIQYPLVELACAIASLYLFLQFGISFEFILLALLIFLLIGTFVSDLLYMEVYDLFMLPAALAAFGYIAISGFVSITSSLIGGAIGFVFFTLQYVLTKGRGIGAGDIRIGFIMGLLLGFPLVLSSLMIAYVGGSVICIGLLIAKKITRDAAVPLGVFLIPALIVVFIFHESISIFIRQYFGFYF
jgi:prepilin signal peptidase PulO-like enzyme (type II secretory pathway)